jgi:hypothetical protein
MPRTARTFAAIAAAILLLPTTADASTQAPPEAADLTLVNPSFESSYGKVVRVAASLDGTSIGDCRTEPPPAKDVCIETAIAAGPHVLELAITVRDGTTRELRTFRTVEKFSAGLRGHWQFDIQGSVRLGAKQSDYLTAAEPLAPVEGCVRAVERLAGLPTCTSADLAEAARGFSTAISQCQSPSLAGTVDDLEHALLVVFANNVFLPVERCYGNAEIRKLPKRMTQLNAAAGAWPPDASLGSSWQWARDLGDDFAQKVPDDASSRTVLGILQQANRQMAARLAVFDEIAAAYLGSDAVSAMDAARHQPWSLDPQTPQGHRNILLLADPKLFGDTAYRDFAAEGVARDPSLDCSLPWQTELLLRNFTQQKRLSEAGWRAVVAMLERTPPDGDYNRCDDAADPRLASPVPALERLHRLGQLDCASTRHPSLRGKTLEPFLRADFPDADPAMQAALKAEFATCLAEVKP